MSCVTGSPGTVLGETTLTRQLESLPKTLPFFQLCHYSVLIFGVGIQSNCVSQALIPTVSSGNGSYKTTVSCMEEMKYPVLLMANQSFLIQGANKPQPSPECVLPSRDTDTAGEPFLASEFNLQREKCQIRANVLIIKKQFSQVRQLLRLQNEFNVLHSLPEFLMNAKSEKTA